MRAKNLKNLLRIGNLEGFPIKQKSIKWRSCKQKLKQGAIGIALGASVISGGCAGIFKAYNPMYEICRTERSYGYGQRGIKNLIKELRQSAVLINSNRAQGSGIIIGHKNNETIILTNRHVVDPDENLRLPGGLQIRNNGKSVVPTRILIAPQDLDLAVVFVKGRIGPCREAEMDAPTIGGNVFVVGSPLGSEDSITKGIISNLNPEKTKKGFKYNIIQTDAAVNPGNSGGGIFDAKTGELLGIISYKLRMSMFETAEGMAYALPISILKEFPYSDWLEVKRD
jgi:S1-C subfamily serine protease